MPGSHSITRAAPNAPSLLMGFRSTKQPAGMKTSDPPGKWRLVIRGFFVSLARLFRPD
jgi:hypothetical protein